MCPSQIPADRLVRSQLPQVSLTADEAALREAEHILQGGTAPGMQAYSELVRSYAGLLRKAESLASTGERLQSELMRLSDRLAELSNIDPLTGLANSKAFDSSLVTEWNRAARAQTAMAILLVDIDHFAAYNERYGPARGDQCLKHIASVLPAVCRRPGDLAARSAGDSFAVLLPDTDTQGAHHVAEVIAARVAKLALTNRAADEGTVGVSIGLGSGWPDVFTEPGVLLELAAQALSEAKIEGSGLIVLRELAS